MTEPLYIWIVRWGDFQHYAPERDRAPAWIKAYTKQHDDDEYRDLSMHARGVLHDLRIAFARARGSLSADTRRLSDRLGQRVTMKTLIALNDAGFILLLSREALDRALDDLYASRARARAHHPELEEELEEEPPSVLPAVANYDNGRTDGDLSEIDPVAILHGASS